MPGLRTSLIAIALTACGGGTTHFTNTTPDRVVATLPAPPPPAPTPPPAPPRIEVRDNQIVLHEKIQFDWQKATIRTESHSLLDDVVKTFADHPQIKKVSIDGFASSDGDAAFNRRLSDDRAKAVLAYLVGHGVDRSRVVAKGWGADRPIADNATAEGREANRRVELNILEQEVTRQKVEIDQAGHEKVVDTRTEDVTAGDGAGGAAK